MSPARPGLAAGASPFEASSSTATETAPDSSRRSRSARSSLSSASATSGRRSFSCSSGARRSRRPADHAATRTPPGTRSSLTSNVVPSSRAYGPADTYGPAKSAAAAAARAPPFRRAAAARPDWPRRSDARPGSSTVPLEQIGQSAVKRLWRQKSEEEDTGLRGRLLLRLSRPRAVGGRGRAAARRRSALARPGRAVLLLGRRPRSRLARPVLIELDAPLPVVSLLELQLRLEGAAGAAAEAGDGLLGLEVRHQLADDRDRQDLPRLPLPDHEPAARAVLSPARGALAVRHHVAAAARAPAQVRALHGGEEGRLGVAPRRLRLLAQGLDRQRLHRLALLELRQQLVAARVVVRALGGLGLLAVHGLPARLDQAPPAGAEHVLGDGGLHARALEDGIRVEDRQEALGHEVVPLPP